ncbi:hypothetical protein HRR83_008886 [Exophiala dermatitidis]|uniref:Uncharacterized protein n=1 Tax=Exophiala dermatitidis TaxID=5970 RepID=A0AAN6EL37_EXODE|nr:hypothetical protein HRR73_008849 [Exophiala dermatitidis]KAJ4504674.1 hypothetical protein HRR74_008940 [Exophiala dermatitidis]KAJ4533554.1 hypothetical protein HRR77_008530 [Exophiala dermatitidis]KAJ4540351.1 hypothetical protein HRR76_003753 [Exophiala dermatitidis]KAJ4559163.1 hypothetical protein HRR79_008404 [Exophiala dermatitidis]
MNPYTMSVLIQRSAERRLCEKLPYRSRAAFLEVTGEFPSTLRVLEITTIRNMPWWNGWHANFCRFPDLLIPLVPHSIILYLNCFMIDTPLPAFVGPEKEGRASKILKGGMAKSGLWMSCMIMTLEIALWKILHGKAEVS